MLEVCYKMLMADLARIREAIQQVDLSEKLAELAPEAATRMLQDAQRELDHQVAKFLPSRVS